MINTEGFYMIRDLQNQGHNISQISRKTGYYRLQPVHSENASPDRVFVPRDWVGKNVRIIRMKC